MMDTYLRGDTNTFHRKSIRQPVASRVLASSSLLTAPLRARADAVADVTVGYTYLRRARVQGEWHVHDVSLGALHCAAIIRDTIRSHRLKYMEKYRKL